VIVDQGVILDQGPIEYWTPHIYVWVVVIGVAIVTGVGTVALFLATAGGTNPPPAWLTVAFVFASSVVWYGVLTLFAIEIAVSPNDGRVAFRSIAKERQTNLAEITAISLGGGPRSPVTVRYRGGTARVPMYLDWNDFISRVRERNPDVEISGF
jgi:hypothetical protein